MIVFFDSFILQIARCSMQAYMKAGMVTDKLRIAYFERCPIASLILQSDSGSQYCSLMFQDALKA